MGKRNKNMEIKQPIENTDENVLKVENQDENNVVQEGDTIVTQEDTNVKSEDVIEKDEIIIPEDNDDLEKTNNQDTDTSIKDEKDLVQESSGIDDISSLGENINTIDPLDLINSLLTSNNLDLKVFGAELKDFVDSYSKKSAIESNNGNRKLYNLLLRTLKLDSYEEFKVKFDLVNKLFLTQEFFEPSILLQFTEWSRSEKDIANFAQIIVIIEDLADVRTRQSNKKRIPNLSNLSLDEKSIENIKKYYKL